ncbi:winged helix-turn-helix transcriptional regulator [Cellulosilyticum lentocellum]|uniref:Transcriptional regulator, HxlR family n=1 Tax=Cellulosilyticum lentocellum (strain ATCC 49066 / DSM 5427 / NCIMB 11756 / RHM5) TaxID=642492 RepID=F2JPQ1_CELLD|nr:helix-turn-helix domain-containing protein [Cellulosilyticum lentocellum]ADZ83711.1 transcriptional regulator, HxlR family [Cellulosilyticum lentocellum DSM 5427]
MTLNLREDLKSKFRKGEFNCEKELTLSIISGKWKVVIIYHLGHEGAYRYGALKRLFLGNISNQILAKQLRELEQDGIVERTVYPEIPPRVEYNLTTRGYTLVPIIDSLYEWGKTNMDYYIERLLIDQEQEEELDE